MKIVATPTAIRLTRSIRLKTTNSLVISLRIQALAPVVAATTSIDKMAAP